MTEDRRTWVRLARISAAIGRETLDRGGVLIHGGLAATPLSPAGRNFDSPGGSRGGAGILLAGRSGVGKSTASRRLPPPWRSLCDDVTLVVRDEAGRYWAHPFPTWSRFFGEEAGDGSDTWDLQETVPLNAIFVLEQGPDDRAEPIGGGHTLALLSELANQATNRFSTGCPIEAIAAFHLARYHNLCALVRAVPAHLLHVSLTGAFWGEVARVLYPTV
ncbi:MAG: SynChlorMet cassette protein ScmC, partial [Candidatus Aminicenantes bacterium]|nr:SynChlorMet cassette protein ScmC [Candidatus Aminicenantes bacterium]